MAMSFSRIGNSIQVPVSADSASNQIPWQVPTNAKTFMFVNPTPYDIRLEGTPKGAQAFVPVTSSTGWLILARTTAGPFRTKNPEFLSAQVFSTPGVPVPPDADFSGCWLELVYGDGD